MSRLAITLKKLRETRNVTQHMLAEMSGLGKGTIGDMERGIRSSKPKTLEKIAKALALSEDERKELFACLIPEDLGLSLTKREKIQKDEFMNQATLMFNDDKISEEDKEKIFMALNQAFFTAKELNKRKK